jgi:Leucine-rich repeat (LRR) protein
MKTTLLFSAALIAANVSAQTYQEITGTPFTSGANPSMEFFDKDGDGDKDVIICAYDHTVSAPFSRLYENDGSGSFTLVSGPFEGINLGDVAIGDIDGDNDLDMVIIGKNTAGNSSTKVYLNNGSGVYSIKPGTGLPDIGAGCVELGDLDADGDLDLYIDGSTTAAYPFVNYTGLFVNDGNGNFTQNTSNTFVSRLQSTKLVDLDNDGYLDIVASGYSNGVGSGTDFYKNTGGLNFNAAVAISTYGGEIGLIDVNNDNAIDMIIGGTDNATSNKAVGVFLNNGSASFSLIAGNSFGEYNDVYFSSNDFDADGDKDITLVGWESTGGGHIAKQFLNNGSGVFTQNTGATFTGVRNGNIISTDVNGNGKLEILIVGYTNSGNIANLYEEEPACIINIPDANFKAYLVGNTAINTNADAEIQCAEASAYTGSIYCQTSNISDLTGIEAFTNITQLDCYGNQLTSLNVSSNTALTLLSCWDNQISTLDLSQNSNLVTLDCGTNLLSNLDVTLNTDLTSLSCYNNTITSIDISQNALLTTFACNGNQFTNIDVSQHSNLNFLHCSNNQLTELNLANGNNTNFSYFGAINNSSLTCIEVDDANYSTTNWTSIDSQTAFSENCASVGISEVNSIDVTAFPNPTSGIVNFTTTTSIATIEIYNLTGQKVSQFSNTQTIDISNLPCGIYTASVQTKSGKTTLKKLVKE